MGSGSCSTVESSENIKINFMPLSLPGCKIAVIIAIVIISDSGGLNKIMHIKHTLLCLVHVCAE